MMVDAVHIYPMIVPGIYLGNSKRIWVIWADSTINCLEIRERNAILIPGIVIRPISLA
jgi:hypothetical protein